MSFINNVRIMSSSLAKSKRPNAVPKNLFFKQKNSTSLRLPNNIYINNFYLSKHNFSTGKETRDTSKSINHPFTEDGAYKTNPQLNQFNESHPSINTGSDYLLPHPIWEGEYVNKVDIKFRPADNLLDKLARTTITVMRFNFDLISGYFFGKLTTKKCLNRIMFLESVAGVPGSIAGTLRHLSSLRNMRRDHGWIHTLFEEAENERMHLLIASQMKQPSTSFRVAVFLTQGVFFNFFWVAYLVSPKFCHRLVGYLEEQAVVTYEHILKNIDDGTLAEWRNEPCPQIAINYWQMPQNSTVRDMILRLKADEAHHRDVNHKFADIKSDEPNPFRPGH